MRALLVVIAAVAASGACKPLCHTDADCKLDDDVCVGGFCEAKTIYTCEGDTLVASTGPEDRETFECLAFFSKCAATDDDSASCVRPNGGQACKHMLEDCGIVLTLKDGTQLDELGCAATLHGANDCVNGCLGTAACDVDTMNACLTEPSTCEDPPAPEGEADAGPAPTPGPDAP